MFFKQAFQEVFPNLGSGMFGEELAGVSYDEELKIKQQALQLFWKENKLDGIPNAVEPSPRSRGYRTTTKRRVFFERGTLKFNEASSPLEPPEHNSVYAFLYEKLSTSSFSVLAHALNWIIIRGSYKYRVVIFNIYKVDAGVIRKLKQMAKHLQNENLKVTAAFVYVDPTRSDYYLEAIRPVDSLAFKQLYGPSQLSLNLDNFSLKYPVTGFSQVNESQIPLFIAHAVRMLGLTLKDRLLDLYCGYGLFSFTIGKSAGSVLGVDWEGPSVESAKVSARYLKRKQTRFITGNIDAQFIDARLPHSDEPECILLDPPRKGTVPGVIGALAKRKPKCVLHIFCGTDAIPSALREWAAAEYIPKEIQPLDMFPGTFHLENLILLIKK